MVQSKGDSMTIEGKDITKARATLGKRWKLGRQLKPRELGRLLYLKGRNPGDTIMMWENGESRISGPAERCIEALLDGWLPKDIEHHVVVPE